MCSQSKNDYLVARMRSPSSAFAASLTRRSCLLDLPLPPPFSVENNRLTSILLEAEATRDVYGREIQMLRAFIARHPHLAAQAPPPLPPPPRPKPTMESIQARRHLEQLAARAEGYDPGAIVAVAAHQGVPILPRVADEMVAAADGYAFCGFTLATTPCWVWSVVWDAALLALECKCGMLHGLFTALERDIRV